MVDKVSESKRSEIMRAVRNKDSKIEVQFRIALWRAGYRYRKNAENYFGKPDMVLRKYKTAIFIDSCFWHGCEEHCRMPSTSKDYWVKKIDRNRRRDAEVNDYYQQKGWRILRIWEHDIKTNIDEAIATTINALNSTA